jgi:peroxiredoxin
MGSVPYPQGAKAKYNGNIVSGLFLVDKGTQSLKLDINQFRKTPFIDNEVMKEYYEDYTTAFKAYKIKLDKFYHDWDSLLKVHDRKLPKDIEFTFRAKQNRYYRQSDSLLTRFIVTHPASYLGLWKLVEIASFSGYESIYDTAFTNLADALKNTHTGQQLSKKLISGRTLVPGKQFPTMHCLNEDNVPLTISSKNQYTLIDFWYSNCSPCISQFPNFNSLYKQFHTAGFEIIGISTDKKKYEINWKKAIIKHNLVWPQYWDVDGEEALKHSINAFPTNFLLNAQRQVIRKNISPVELEQFLIDNLK